MKKIVFLTLLAILLTSTLGNVVRSANQIYIGDVLLKDKLGLYVQARLGDYFTLRFGNTKNKINIWHDGSHVTFKSYRGGFKLANTLYPKHIIPRLNNKYSLGNSNFRFKNLWLSGKVHCSGADIAEIFRVSESVQSGDVLQIDPYYENRLCKSKTANSKLVVGVCSTDPGMIMGFEDYNPVIEAPIAMSGTVPCKVNCEGGKIKPGDLLTSSSMEGYAMRANLESVKQIGSIIGKALESHEFGTGKIKILVLNL